MLQIDTTTQQMSINRGDDNQIFKLKVLTKDETYYTFQIGDIVKFGVYEEKGFNKPAVLLKTIEVTEETQELTITLTKEETTIGVLINKPVKYWYEIQVNDNTVIGYTDDKNGPKIFKLFPEGSDVKNGSGEE